MKREQRCGTCKWFRQKSHTHTTGECIWPLPILLPWAFNRIRVAKDTGTKCPTWEAQQVEEKK